MGAWTEALAGEANADHWAYLKWLLIANLGTAVAYFFRSFIMFFYNFKLATKLHEEMVARLLKAPINLYFDITPIGRVLSKFTKDLSAVDEHLPGITQHMMCLFYALVGCLLTTVWIAPKAFLCTPFVIAAVMYLHKNSIKGFKELERIGTLMH